MEKNKKKDTIFSEYEIMVDNLRGLNEAGIKELFAGYDVFEVRIVQKDSNQPPRAFVTFRSPDEQQRVLKKKMFIAQNKKSYLVKRAKVTNPAREKFKVQRIQKTLKSDEQKMLEFEVKGFSSDRIIDLAQTELKFKFVIRNKSIHPKKITYVGVSGTRAFFTCKINKIHLPRDLPGYSNLELNVCFQHRLKEPASCFTSLIVETDKHRFPYELVFNVSSLDDTKFLAKQGEYVEKEDLTVPANIIPAPALLKASKTHIHTKVETFYTVPLPLYEVPEDIKQKVMETDTYPDFYPWKSKEHWVTRLHQLLWFEEVEMEKKSHKFDLRGVIVRELSHEEVLQDRGQPELDAQLRYSEISVPGLSDNRPSVLNNDYVVVWAVGATHVAYEGRVAKVREKTIIVQFHQDFHENFQPDTQFNVRFRFDRLHMRNWHRALDKIDLDILWPSENSLNTGIVPPLTKNDIHWYDQQIPKNPEQTNAIVTLLNKKSGFAPFLLFGPFGTGKTKCLIEYTRQVLRLEKDCRILVCAHSNSGTNKFVEELMDTLAPHEFLRLFSFNTNPSTYSVFKQFSLTRADFQPFNVLKYTYRDPETGRFIPPPMEQLRSYRVILSTGDNAALLHGIGIGSNHFTHIIVDEAAEFSEPNICVPLCLASKKTTVLLAGDNKQTSPRIFSRIAKHHGLAISLMERLSTSSIYRQEGNSPTDLLAPLIRNYRSHPKIITFLSNQFYGGRLICQTNKHEYRSLERWSKRDTKQDFPFLFYALDNSKEDREADSPGYFNIDEAITITSLAVDLIREVRSMGQKIRQEDICVLSASKKQSQKIRMLMKRHKLSSVEVGTTEALQGREFKAIFISTVRSSTNLLEFDRQHNIGFIADEKRFNTAISRAVALVVVVGNSRLLAQVEMWKNFIRYCSANGSYVNLMSGAVAGEEMIRELEDEEEESRKKAAKEAKEAKIEAHLAEVRAKKKLNEQSNGEQKNSSFSQPSFNQAVNSATNPKVNLPPTQAAANTNQLQAPVAQSYYSYPTQNGDPHGVTSTATINGTNSSAQPPLQQQRPQIIPLYMIEGPHAMQGSANPFFQLNVPVANGQQPYWSQQSELNSPATQNHVPGNVVDDESWTTVDKAKSVTLSTFLEADLIVAFKDKGLKGYPPLTVERHITTPSTLIVTFYVIRMHAQVHRRNGFVILEFFSVPQDPLLVASCNLIPFDIANSAVNFNVGSVSILLSKVRLNVPDGYDCVVQMQNDRLVLLLSPHGTVVLNQQQLEL